MSLTLDQVRHVAQLARLALTPEEEQRYQTQLSAILEAVEKLKALDTSAVEPTSHAVDLVNVMRDDEVTACLPPDAALANAPDPSGELFRVPRIIEE